MDHGHRTTPIPGMLRLGNAQQGNNDPNPRAPGTGNTDFRGHGNPHPPHLYPATRNPSHHTHGTTNHSPDPNQQPCSQGKTHPERRNPDSPHHPPDAQHSGHSGSRPPGGGLRGRPGGQQHVPKRNEPSGRHRGDNFPRRAGPNQSSRG